MHVARAKWLPGTEETPLFYRSARARLEHRGKKSRASDWKAARFEASTLTGGSSRDPVRPDLIVFLLLRIRDKNLATI